MISIVVDVEADGPSPLTHSMVSFGAIVLEPDLTRTFFGEVRPIYDEWVPEALAVSGYSRAQTLQFEPPDVVMPRFADWVDEVSGGRRPQFWSDNNGFDWSFMNAYLWRFVGRNPFGHSSHNAQDLYKGLCRTTKANFKRLRKTRHTHNPVDDAKGNAEALLTIRKRFNYPL